MTYHLINEERLKGTVAYLDNITVGGIDQKDHDKNVRNFYEFVTKYNFTLNNDKSVVSVTEINMLGYLISHGNIKPDPDRMKPLRGPGGGGLHRNSLEIDFIVVSDRGE